jgi:hypothetical protein
VERAVQLGAQLVYAPHAVVWHPTLDTCREYMRKLWRVSYWATARRARVDEPPSWRGLLGVLPLVGVALSRREKARPIARLNWSRMATCGVAPSRQQEFRALAAAYLAAFPPMSVAQVTGRRRGRRLASEGVARTAIAVGRPQQQQAGRQAPHHKPRI